MFGQADPWYLNNVEGLKPEKEKHEFYVDISPKFGFPLAIRPKFQLNAIIERDADIEVHYIIMNVFHLKCSSIQSSPREMHEILHLYLFPGHVWVPGRAPGLAHLLGPGWIF